MAYTKKAELTESVKGAWIEFGTLTANPASIAAGANGTVVVSSVSNVAVGDQVWLNPQTLDNDLVATGAKVTGTGAVTIYLLNPDAGGASVDGIDLTYDVMIVHTASGLEGGS
jgi:hypothetical protein